MKEGWTKDIDREAAKRLQKDIEKYVTAALETNPTIKLDTLLSKLYEDVLSKDSLTKRLKQEDMLKLSTIEGISDAFQDIPKTQSEKLGRHAMNASRSVLSFCCLVVTAAVGIVEGLIFVALTVAHANDPIFTPEPSTIGITSLLFEMTKELFPEFSSKKKFSKVIAEEAKQIAKGIEKIQTESSSRKTEPRHGAQQQRQSTARAR